jgi:hypothetical protein
LAKAKSPDELMEQNNGLTNSCEIAQAVGVTGPSGAFRYVKFSPKKKCTLPEIQVLCTIV